MKTDIEIAQAAKLLPITEIAKKIGLEDYVEMYGKSKAKIDLSALNANKKGKLILVTAINPTPAGEGKTTTSIGLADSLNYIGKNTVLALREPSLGPVFGIKGGATGGGYAQVVPMEDINLHFTGDFAAIAAATNLLAALLDNHIHHGNTLNIDPRTITLKRVVDMNDRQLRFIVDGLNGKINGVPREDGFEIVVASEVMAILCLANDLMDLKQRISKMVVAHTYDKKEVTAADLQAQDAMTILLKEAIKPNLVQTLHHTPAIIHGGPFANIAHGCNSVIATKLALQYGDYVVTEAGFGADLGAEKFLDIKCRSANLKPDAVVIVATLRALKMHGGLSKDQLNSENIEALQKGLPNLLKHIENMRDVFQLNCVVAINKFPTDSENELMVLKQAVEQYGVETIVSDVFSKGASGGIELATAVVKLCEKESKLQFAYDITQDYFTKITQLAKNIYGASSVSFSLKASRKLKEIVEFGHDYLPICVAKTQYSFSDDKTKLGAPDDFEMVVNDVKLSNGAGFVVVYCGDIMTMPGLPKIPAANNMQIDENNHITGLS